MKYLACYNHYFLCFFQFSITSVFSLINTYIAGNIFRKSRGTASRSWLSSAPSRPDSWPRFKVACCRVRRKSCAGLFFPENLGRTDCEGGYVVRMTCNPIQAPRFLPDGIPSMGLLLFLFLTTCWNTFHLHSERPPFTGSSTECCRDAPEPGALVQRRTCIFSEAVSCGEQTTGFTITSCIDWATWGKSVRSCVFDYTVISLSHHTINEQK